MNNPELGKYEKIINAGTMNVILFASFVIIIAILTTGISNYVIVKNALVNKLKDQDLDYILKSISVQIDDRINRAKETSLIIADNPEIIKWFSAGENGHQYEEVFIQQMKYVANNLHYTVFFANKRTGHYWTNSDLLTDTLSKNDPADRWFFDSLASRQKINLNIDHNKELNQTNLWINTLMGDVENPIGVAGVGVDLQDISNEFSHYKMGDQSNLWLVNVQGKISIAEDAEQSGGKLSDYLPADVYSKIMKNTVNSGKPTVISYFSKDGQVDLIFQKLKSCDWILVFQVNRSETMGLLDSILVSTLVTLAVVLVLILIVFFLVSSRIANPYKRAVQVNIELEKEIEERTAEISEKNQKIMESIQYAKTIQESILPTNADIEKIFPENFVLWRPRDIVGGDFYWFKRIAGGSIIVVGDCTGHGVPAALMTMAVNSLLSNIVIDKGTKSPVVIISELNRQLKEALNKGNGDHAMDDGLDAAIGYYDHSGKLYFAGAGINLYRLRRGQVSLYKGHKRGIGYVKSKFTSDFENQEIEVVKGDRFYITTDGFVDQNGGADNYSLGKKRFEEMIIRSASLPMVRQGLFLAGELDQYKGQAAQRDDITVVGFQII